MSKTFNICALRSQLEPYYYIFCILPYVIFYVYIGRL